MRRTDGREMGVRYDLTVERKCVCMSVCVCVCVRKGVTYVGQWISNVDGARSHPPDTNTVILPSRLLSVYVCMFL